VVVCLECQAKFVVEDPQIAVLVAHDSLRYDRLQFLRQYADVCLVAAVISETIEANSIIEAAEKRDVVLNPQIGPSTAAASPAEAAARSTEAAAPGGACATAAHPDASSAASAVDSRGRGADIAPRGGPLACVPLPRGLAVSCPMFCPGMLRTCLLGAGGFPRGILRACRLFPVRSCLRTRSLFGSVCCIRATFVGEPLLASGCFLAETFTRGRLGLIAKPLSYVRISIRHGAPVSRIMGPVYVSDVGAIEVVIAEGINLIPLP
jgi:hypothetical protein